MTSERKYLVLSAIGPDKVGLVEQVAQFVFERGGNVEDSRMALLGGEFSLLVLVSGSAQAIATIASDNSALEKTTGLTVQCRPTIAPGERRAQRTLPYELTASSLDH
ncbi:MAG: ACT domain-containing protein, partial [bacterium]